MPYQLSDSRMNDSPWLKSAVIYHIFIDRFLRGGARGSHGRSSPAGSEAEPVFCGGNLQGVAEKMDYLSELGINTVWLSPFNKTTAYHGYHITDFFKVEERFGGQKGFEKLVKAARSHRIRLIMDFVPNHVSVEHPIFRQAIRNKRSPFRQWFYWTKNVSYARYLGVAELAKVNLDSKPADLIEDYCAYFPPLSSALLTILAISHAGYLTVKAAPHTRTT